MTGREDERPSRRRSRISQAVDYVWSSSVVRYLVVGGGAFLIDVGLLAGLHNLLSAPLVVATPAAFLMSFAITFVLQRTFTFGSKAGVTSSAVKYTAVVIFNTFATTGIVSLAASLGVPWIIGKIVAVGSTTVWNYFLYRHWIFAGRRRIQRDG